MTIIAAITQTTVSIYPSALFVLNGLRSLFIHPPPLTEEDSDRVHDLHTDDYDIDQHKTEEQAHGKALDLAGDLLRLLL
jgi:hypothetical protein